MTDIEYFMRLKRNNRTSKQKTQQNTSPLVFTTFSKAQRDYKPNRRKRYLGYGQLAPREIDPRNTCTKLLKTTKLQHKKLLIKKPCVSGSICTTCQLIKTKSCDQLRKKYPNKQHIALNYTALKQNKPPYFKQRSPLKKEQCLIYKKLKPGT